MGWGYSTWTIVFAVLFSIGTLGALVAGCAGPKNGGGFSTLMTFLVFSWNFMLAFVEWYTTTYNEIGLWRDYRAMMVVNDGFGLFIFWFCCYQILEAAKPPMDNS